MTELSHEFSEFASRPAGPAGLWPAFPEATELGGRAALRLPLEIAFLSGFRLAPDELDAALRDIASGAAPDAAVLADGLIDDEDYYRALAQALGCAYFTGEIEFGDALDPARALRSGLAPLARNPFGLGAVIAPRGSTIAGLVDAVASGRLSADGFAVASPRRLAALIRSRHGQAILEDALRQPSPLYSARGGMEARQIATLAATILASLAVLLAYPDYFHDFLTIGLWLVFSSAVLLRSCALISGGPARVALPLSDRDLPVYTVVVALYDETEVLSQLVGALDALNYPGIIAHPPQAA